MRPYNHITLQFNKNRTLEAGFKTKKGMLWVDVTHMNATDLKAFLEENGTDRIKWMDHSRSFFCNQLKHNWDYAPADFFRFISARDYYKVVQYSRPHQPAFI